MTARILEVLTPGEAKQTHIKNSMCRYCSESKQCDALFRGRFTASAATTQKMENAIVFNASLNESLLFLPGSILFY